MNIFDQYGIKEVADVTLYSIHKKKDGSGELYYVPALYLDTLKISSMEKTASNTWAQGGLGNSRLICWDFGKEINVSLEDALCTPASLGLCWGGILGADWENGKVKQDFGISYNNDNSVERISRFENVFYPKSNREKSTISYLLPQTKEDLENTKVSNIINESRLVDGTKVDGFGNTQGHVYHWNMAIETDMKSILIVPDKFFDIYGNDYEITGKKAIGITIPQTKEFQYEITYAINGNEVNADDYDANIAIFDPSTLATTIEEIENAKFLRIRVDNDGNYTSYIGETPLNLVETKLINVEQFKGIDMWIHFQGINELIYFILTKYEDNVYKIVPTDITNGGEIGVTYNTSDYDDNGYPSQLWAYVNPKTMQPYPDDYWFNQGERYFVKSLTLAPKNKKLKAKKIKVMAGQFPGMYMLVGETFVRSRDTQEDERMQIKIPYCKVKSDHSLTLEAEGDPTVFNLELEVAKPQNGVMVELTAYETAVQMEKNEEGFYEAKDGSTSVLSE